MTSDDFEAGRQEGRIERLEASVKELKTAVKSQDRILWILTGAMSFIIFLPKIKEILI